MKGKKYDYYRAVIRKAEQIIELETLQEFVHYTNANHIRQIILAADPEKQSPLFALASKGALYVCQTTGFNTLEDYQHSTENGFPDAVTFYDALSKKCNTFDEYEVAIASGITEAAEFDKIKAAGYIEGYLRFDDLRKQDAALPQMEDMQSARALFEYASSKSFTDFAHFLKVWQAGFVDPIEHQLAIEKGLNNQRDFETFRKGNFNTLDEFKLAKQNNITTWDELKQYQDLHYTAYPNCTFDELLLINIASKLENGSKTEFQKLYTFFLKTEEEYKRPSDKGEMKLPAWYSKRLRKEEDVKNFLINNDKVKHFGTFHSATNIFETIHVKLRKVVVDGSNVAHNSNLKDRKAGKFTAELKNILILVKKLRDEYHFEDIHVISDFNLIHKVSDKELLKEIKALCKYSDTPVGIPADLYLINHVKKHHCLLVTNDVFRDWKAADKWVEDNIDFYRLKFVLNGNAVMLPYMERFEK